MVRLKTCYFFGLLLVIIAITQYVTAGLPRSHRAIRFNTTKECTAIPPAPHNAEVKCHSTACAVSCIGDSKFDFGGNKIVIVCKNNIWAPIVKHIKTVSDCKAPCDPPCLSGRTCFAKNHCGCPDNFGGDNCKERKECPKGQIYKTCGDSCTLTCKALRSLPCTSQCVPGCTCANGWSKDASGICIQIIKCPCLVGGVEQADGHFELKKMGAKYEACTCSAQKWTCNTVKKGYASMTGDPHYTSIDGQRFDFMGHCVYTLLKHTEFAIEGENVACAGTSEGIKFEADVKNVPSCTKSLTIRVQQLTIHLLQNHEVMINGRKVTKFPFTMLKTTVSQISSNFTLAEFADGVEVKWDGSTTAYVTVPEKFYGHVKGLLGTYNNNPNDDMTKADGTLANSVEDLGNSWKVDESCPNVKPVPHPCEVYPEKHDIAEHQCSPLKSQVFASCHATINPQSFYDNCLYDVCQCRNNEVKSCLCPILDNYVSLCQLENITIHSWKNHVPICGIQCPPGQISQCGNACSRTCRDILNANCKSPSCIDDCYCPVGQAFNHKKICVPNPQCDCVHDDVEYLHGHKILRTRTDGKAEHCQCQGGKWSCTEQPEAICRLAGDPHYESFDRRRFSFQGDSSYYLLVLDKELMVEATNWFCGQTRVNQGNTCTKSLTVRVQRLKVELLQGRQVKVNGRSVHLPWQQDGILVHVISSSMIMATMSNGVTLQWDGNQNFFLRAPGQLFGKTKGLCGNFNNDMNDDFKTPQGVLTSNSNDFGNSWKTDDTSLDVAFLPHPCDRSADIAANATALCRVVKEAVFTACHALVDPNSAYENCRFDVCACSKVDRAKCSCPVIAAYGEECTKMHMPINWRDSVDSCKLKCPAGQVYQPCGDICGRTCLALSLPCSMKNECVEGCNCPPGQTLDGTEKCIDRDQCPCIHGKIQFKKGQQITRDLEQGQFERCTCNNARWSCEPQSNAWCSVVGYAHYTTFDGKKYDFMGTCSYYLVKHATFSIEINNDACLIPSCRRSLVVRVRKDRLELLRDLEVKLNGQPMRSLPLVRPGAFTIRRASDSQIIVILWNEVEVRWDGNMAIYVQAPGTLYSQNTQGLCGTFNGNVHDEWSTPENKVIEYVETFANSWKSNENCDVVHSVPKPCEENLKRKENAKRYCDILQEGIFSECHTYADVNSAIADCQFDTCASSELSERDAQCHAISAYVTQCTWSHVMLTEWRTQVPGCEISCPADQEYQTCGSPCGRTCRDVPIPCISKCVEGCNCPEGQSLDREGGTCIPVSRCPCQYRGRQYDSDTNILQHNPVDNSELYCTCINADWVCTKQNGARCTSLDATFFTSFDGHNFNVVSVCPIYLLKTEILSIVLLSEEKCTNPINDKCTRPLLITMDKVKIKMLSNKIAVFNSVKITKFPYKQQNVKIRIASSSFIVVHVDNDVEVWWDGAARIYIDISAQFYGKTQGICGSFNSNPNDDLTTKEGKLTISSASFASSWSADSTCVEPSVEPPKCDKPIPAENDCRQLKSKLFADCNAVIDPEAMYETCLLQLCNCHTIPDCVCPIYSVYASQCAALDITINWRRHIKMCAIDCPAGQEYQVCHDPCTRSCRDLQQSSCERKCVEGCNCPEGRTLNDKDECIPMEECKCEHENKEYGHDETVIRKKGDDTEFCTCVEGRWVCKEQKSARCSVLNNKFVKTFGNRRIEVDNDCEYYLIKQEELSVSSGPSCNQDQSSCVTSLKLDWGSQSLTLTEGDSQVIYNGRPTAPPITNPNLVLLEESSMSLLVKLMKLDVQLRWDKADKIDLHVPPTFVDKTKGLCGTFSSEQQTDLKLWDGKSTDNVALFARSWQVHPRCIAQPRFVNNSACDENDQLKPGEINECDVMKQSIFEPCQSTAVGILIEAFYSSCMSEKCSCVNDDSLPCTCTIIGDLAMECSKTLNEANFDWRPLAPKCGAQCEAGLQYQSCGDDCTHSCAAISAAANIKCSRRCVEGCRCPNGQSIDRLGKCVPTAKCPCLHNSIEHQPGEKVTRRDGKRVEHCECQAGRWACQDAPTGRCSNIGLAHYTTFDGKNYNFKAQCQYFLLRMPQFSVQIDVQPCPANTKVNASSDGALLCKTVKIQAGNVRIEISQMDKKILADGQQITALPVIKRDAVSVRRASDSTIIVEQIKNGVEIWWNDDGTLRIDVPPSYEGKTEGLCGTFNGKSGDDMTTSEGEVTLNLLAFINSWRVSPTCNEQPEINNPCDRNPGMSQRAAEICDILNKAPFRACHSLVDVQSYIDICKFELCACNLMTGCACSVFREYAQVCADRGIDHLPWTQQVTECAEKCPTGKVFRTCADSCRRTCDDVSLEGCNSKCVEGCACPRGEALDAQGNCVPLTQCPCMDKKLRYKQGDQIRRAHLNNPTVIDTCICGEGRWSCTIASAEEILNALANVATGEEE